MGHYQPPDASCTTYQQHAELDRELSPRHNNFEFTFTAESKIHLYQPPKHEDSPLQVPKIGCGDDPEDSFDCVRTSERPSSPVPWAFGDDDDASTQGVDPLLLQFEDESVVTNRMGYFDDSDDDDDSLHDPFESQPLAPQLCNSDATIGSTQNRSDENEGERRANEKKDRKQAQLQYVMGSPRRARRCSEEQAQIKGFNASLRRAVLLRNAMMDDCVRREGSPVALTQTLRKASSEAGWDDDGGARMEH
jgi:hypothetical protein